MAVFGLGGGGRAKQLYFIHVWIVLVILKSPTSLRAYDIVNLPLWMVLVPFWVGSKDNFKTPIKVDGMFLAGNRT